ncbi:MAG: NAD(P)/FAD-dependent oxidoreductase [Proteobacteria bacterium]|nr:NAD(P)/FAD-dependent oxidoreductase [Pseudomonadota bacterium]
MNDPLFTEICIGKVKLKNRLYMPAMHLNMCKNFLVTEQLCEFYRERAKGGVGLISVGYATVDELSGTPSNIGAHLDEHVPGLAALAGVIHEGGSKATVQLNHAGRYNMSFFLGGKKPVAPSPVPSRLTRETPEELSSEQIRETVRRFATAAKRVRDAGFDLVEILAGTGYLISEFLSPLTNNRLDQYGGSLENRMRFGLEVIRGIKNLVGDDFPILVRINGNDFMDGGIGPAELLEFAVSLEAEGVHALCINVGWHEAQVPQIVTQVPRGVFSYLARDIKQRVSVPVIASHRINDPSIARLLVEEGFCDMVALGRALIADPFFPEKARTGRDKEIVHCVACGQGCFDHVFKMKPVECLCNPRAGHEYEVQPGKTETPKKVMVVGGGVAGMSAAIAAAEQGHHVSLFETGLRLGGQLHLAGAPPGRGEFLVFAEDMACQVVLHGIKVILNRSVDGQILAEEKPDFLILATGGEPITPPIPGAQQEHVVQAWDVLAGKAVTGRRVAIVGGGSVGIETALFLAEKGALSGEEIKFLLVNGAVAPEKLYQLATKGSKEVTVVEMVDTLGSNFGKSTRWGMLQDVGRYGVKTLTQAKVLTISDKGVRLEHDGEVRELAADSVVLAVGTRSANPLQRVAEELGISCQVVGDALAPATVFEANHQGYNAGRNIG